MSAPSPKRARARPLLLAAALAVVTTPVRARAAVVDGPAQRRFAVLVGNDHGGDDTRALLYAAEDARRMHEVLTRLGGVAPTDAFLLLDRTAGDLLRALGELDARIGKARAAGERTSVVFYYSGHAKDGALRLGQTRVGLDEVKARLQRLPADVTLGIFDSCRSGVVTRTKGARKGPAFDIQAGAPEEARGVVFLSSSSADEDAQESDDIRGSYFSHHLASGLRGSADRSGDGRVTLSEAYAYAYARTVADTSESAAGAQHPTFSYDLKGNADVVLTELAGRRQALLLVPRAAPEGVYYVVRGDIIAAELVKPAGEERRLALEPGHYHVKRRLPDLLRIGQVDLATGQTTTLDEARLHDAPFADDPVKGARPSAGYDIALAGGFQAFFDGPTRDDLFPPTGLLGVEVMVRDFFRRGWAIGFDLSLGGARGVLDRTNTALPFRFGELGLGTSILAEWAVTDDRSVTWFAGAHLAVLFMNRTFDDVQIPKQKFSTFSPGVVGGLRWDLGRGLSLLGRARIHYLLYDVDVNRSLGYWELATAVAYEF